MALVKPFTFESGVVVPEAYFMIDRVSYAKLDMSLSFHLIGWKDAAVRSGFQDALGAFGDAVGKQDAATLALDALKPAETDTLPMIRQKEEASVIARQSWNEAAAILANAQAQAQKIKPLECGSFAFQLPHSQVESVLTDGRPDIVKLYGWVKTQPGWEDATDA